jgi:osmotically-inducible protein OsmY
MVSSSESRADLRRDAGRPAADALAQRIERHIAGRAGGRVRDLRVECADGLVTLRGRTQTHHAKQLAQEAACDLIEGPTALANRIVVQREC